MTDERPFLPPEGREELAELVREIAADAGTSGFTMCATGPELGAVAQTFSDGQYDTHVALCAVLLKEHAAALEAEPQEFVRDVVQEFNDRDVSDEWSR
jgi:hypothetical protein